MTSTVNVALVEKVLDFVANGVTATGAGRWLGLASDASLTEITAIEYGRYDLDAAMAAPSGGACSNNVGIDVDTGSQTATHWFFIDHATTGGTLGKMWSGALSAPITGAQTIPIGAIVLDGFGA